MAMKVGIAARVRGLFAGNYAENREDEQVHVNPRGDLIVAQGLSELAEMVRLGNSWQAAATAGVAAATALPTTTSGLALYNNEPANGNCLVIDSFGVWETVIDATQLDFTSLFATNDAAPVTTVATGSATIASLSGRANYGGLASVKSAGTVKGTLWVPHQTSQTSGIPTYAATSGLWKVTEAVVRGLYVVKPGGAFAINAIKGAAAAAQCFFFVRWHEVQLVYKA
jgi:hypothetical protein